jgi:ferritin-like metal-binding protein YciE
MKLESLKDLYIHELKDLHSAEKQITKALPKMAKAAGSDELLLSVNISTKLTSMFGASRKF